MATYKELVKRTRQMAERVAKATCVAEDLAMNVIVYAKKLTTYDKPDVIDKVVFTAQMSGRFGMSSMFLIKHIYGSLSSKGQIHIKLEDYVRLICIFLTKDLNVKIEYAFKCYDFQKDGMLNNKEAYTFLTSTVIFTGDESEGEENTRELIDLVMKMTDINSDGMISLEEFSRFVHDNQLCLELLGSVLPQRECVDAFLKLIQNKPVHALNTIFENERQVCLNEPLKSKRRDKYYPIMLELP